VSLWNCNGELMAMVWYSDRRRLAFLQPTGRKLTFSHLDFSCPCGGLVLTDFWHAYCSREATPASSRSHQKIPICLKLFCVIEADNISDEFARKLVTGNAYLPEHPEISWDMKDNKSHMLYSLALLRNPRPSELPIDPCSGLQRVTNRHTSQRSPPRSSLCVLQSGRVSLETKRGGEASCSA